MTDTAFYARMDVLATRLLTKFGAPATLHDTQTNKGKANATGDIQPTVNPDVVGLATQTQSELVLNLLNAEVDAALIFKATKVPAPDMTVTHGQNLWKIKAVKQVSPDGQVQLVFFLGVMK